MNKIFACPFLLLISFTSFAQKNKVKELGFLLFDATGNQVKNLDQAATYSAILKPNDTTFVLRNYKNYGPMISQETFLDENLTIPNGRFIYYDKDGNIDSTGMAIHGRKDGIWDTFTHIKNIQTGSVKDSIIHTDYYHLGKRITKEEYFNDTTENSAIKRKFFKTGLPISETQFNADTTGQRAAEYPGKSNAWKNYLEANLNAELGQLIPQYKSLADNRAPVTVVFLVGKDGNTDDIFIANSSGYPFDTEAIRVIENSGKWAPAQQNGHPVVYRQMQSITFVLGY
ncbi:MAG: TonB family protein [Chitinophagaceae bacterium]|jgi:protein TonB|nr:TonB family protein [Chitinophagaceae bacterium]